MSTEEKLPEKCCMRHEVKKGVHWIAAWNHCFTFINVLFALNGIMFLVSRKPMDLTNPDGDDDQDIYDEKDAMYLPDRWGHPWIMSDEDLTYYERVTEDWFEEADSSSALSYAIRAGQKYELSGFFRVPLTVLIPCLIWNLLLVRIGMKRGMKF
jgi:hypothetical protein